jgi:uncharacterized damage-inducible protein DinB
MKTLLTTTLLAAGLMRAQMAGDVKAMFDAVSVNVLKAAEKMPDENYGFQPTPEVRTFARLIGHIADAHTRFCATSLGQQVSPAYEKSAASKADLVKAIKDSNTLCADAYAKATDASLGEKLKMGQRERTRLWFLAFNASHTNEHYGNIVTYMRIKGLVPPSSER